MKILVTGFDPFGGESINPSTEVLKKLPDYINGNKIIKCEIETVAYKSLDKIKNIIIDEKPDIVLSLGQAGGRKTISVEKVAINLNDFRIKDNEGNQIIDEKIFDDGDTAYFSTLPIKAIVKKLIDNNIPATISYSAGTFVCNHVMYGVLYMCERYFSNIKSGFIHIPFIKEQVKDLDTPYMHLEDIVCGVILSIEAIIENDIDIKVIGGNTHWLLGI